LLSGAGLQQVRVRTLNFEHQVESGEHLWRGFAEGGVRNRAFLILQPEGVRLRIRSEFDKRLDPFRTARGFKLPVSIKLASGVKPVR
jgi:hypothetical protein